MARAQFQLSLVREVAAALGLDPDKHPITGIVIDLKVRDVARVSLVMTIEQDGKLVEILKKYHLVEGPGSPPKSWRDEDPLL